MATFDSWASYFYPPPDNATMRNIEGIRDPDELSRFEYGATAWRGKQIIESPFLLPHTYDADHVRAIHQHLFQDVYAWAGKHRTQDMAPAGAWPTSPRSRSTSAA